MLVAIPAIALSMAIMSMRNSTYSIQTSVYVVYLDQMGLVGTTIGILFAAAEIASGFGALFAGRAMRLGDAQRTMLSGTALSILLIAMTPLFGGIFALLLLFQVIRGWLEGVIQPVVLSVQARAVGRHQQGAVVGLRQTGQRLTSIVIPPLMGGDRRPLGGQRKLLHPRRADAAAVRRPAVFSGAAPHAPPSRRRSPSPAPPIDAVARLRLHHCRRRLGRLHLGEPVDRRRGVRVLLLEAGGWDRDPWLAIPLAWGRILRGACTTGCISPSPRRRMDGRGIECARGKVIGGSSSINAMAYVRGHRGDYDRWAEAGLPHWSYAHVLPYFRRQESWEGGAGPYRGADGPLTTRWSRYRGPAVEAFVAAGATAGLPATDDYNGARQEGFGRWQATIREGRRCSAASPICGRHWRAPA